MREQDYGNTSMEPGMELGAQAIFEQLRERILAGELSGGSPLPPVRELAEQCGINRNTAAAVYKRLVAAGLATTQGRLGTVVKDATMLGELEGELRTATPNFAGDLSGGNPMPDLLPDPVTYLAKADYRPRLYGCETVHPALETLAQEWFADIGQEAWQVNVTHGAVDAIERLLMAYLIPGDAVAVEDPCFLGSIHTLKALGLRAVGVAMDGEGMMPEALDIALRGGVRALICTPRAHNPTGCSVSAQRAGELAAMLTAHPQVLLIEDDHFALLADTPYHSIMPHGCTRFACIRSVSKGLGPDLRLALVVSDVVSARRLRARLASGATWVSHVLQATVASMLSDESGRTQLDHARAFYRQHRRFLLDALEQRGLVTRQPCDGLNVWIPLAGHSPRSAHEVAHELARRGWIVRASAAFSLTQRQQAIRVTVSTLDEARAQRFADDLLLCVYSSGTNIS